MKDNIVNITPPPSNSDDYPNTVSLVLRSLLDIQVCMIRTATIIADEKFHLAPLSDTKSKVISKKLDEIKSYIDKEVENVSDLIFSIKEAVVSDKNKK